MSGESIPVEGDRADEQSRQLPDNDVLRGLIKRFENAVWSLSFGQDVVAVPREVLREFAIAARDAGFEMLSDVTATDWLEKRDHRFEVVVNLTSMQHLLRLRLIIPVPGEDPTVPSLVPVWPGANYPEREVYDMFGIVFVDHPDLTRILMPDDWEGYPLRKDFSVGAVPVQFKASHKVT
ncbi:MAG: NADH-quinone oxidoreductase subunit C [Acidimicrobiia bacterium]